MFSSKFLSGANPLSAVSSAVNKFGLFGDDGEGDKKQQQAGQQPATSPGKGPPVQQQRPQSQGQNGQATGQSNGGPQAKGPQQQGATKPGVQQAKGGAQQQTKSGTPEQGPTSKSGPQPAKTEGAPKTVQQGAPKPGQGSPSVGGQQQGPPKTQQKEPAKTVVAPKPGSQQGSPKVGGQQQGAAPKPGQGPSVGGQMQGSPKPGLQQGSPNVGRQQQASPTPGPGSPNVGQMQGSPRPGAQQGSPNVGRQQQGAPKPGSPNVGQMQGSPKPGSQQGSPNVGRQQQASPKPGLPNVGQMQGSPKPSSQQGSPNVGRQQQASPIPGPQQGSPKPISQQQGPPTFRQGPQGPKGSPLPGQSRAGSSSPAGPKAGAKSRICSVCNTTELNMHTKEPPNYKRCTQCKTEVCSLCGFSPPDADGKEWLCLTCQIQRAQGPPGPQLNKPSGKAPPAQSQKSPVPVKKDIAPSSSPQPTSVPAKTDTAKVLETQKPKVTPETAKLPQKSDQSPQPGRKQSSEAPQQSGGLFGFGASKPTQDKESVTGKMFGFGSSFLSSASTLIASAVDDETKTTPPVSPKMQPANQAKTGQEKKQEQPQPGTKGQVKMDKTDTPKDKVVAGGMKDVPHACPICKMGLNQGTGKPPNYSMCTDCKSIVCNQCGFNPMPNVKEGKEWLCLNCQVKRAAGGVEPEVKKTPSPVPLKTTTPASPQGKPHSAKTEGPKGHDKESHKEPSQPPGPKPTQKGPPKPPDQTAQKPRSTSPAPPQQESGGFFGFGASKPDTAKPAESVSGKMFGFGSSIFSSASTLITSAVQDEGKTTPPVSPKMPPAKNSKSPTVAKKAEQDKKPEEAKGQPTGQPKPPSGKSVCPLCKLQLNVGSKDPPNYNTCTECKNVVCNQCGFNPMPNEKGMKEWLCLNCQMQRALGSAESASMPTKKPQASPTPPSAVKKEPSPQDKPQKKDISQPAQPTVKTPAAPGSPQRKPQPGQQPVKPDSAKGPENQRQGSPSPAPKAQDVRKPSVPKPDAPTPTTQGGDGASKPQPDKPADSIGGKMFGFGSSIFSSASTMISSAVQDESKTTPPISPKLPTAKTTKSPQIQRKEEEKKPGQVNQPNATSLPQAKVEKAPSQPVKEQTAPTASKASLSNCPLCKIKLNVGSKDPPNYNTCTQCKETVCNQCGFNPVPNMTKAKEWLCLNCQMQRAIGPSEEKTPAMKSTNMANKGTVQQKLTTSKQGEPMKKEEKDSVVPDAKSSTAVPIKKTPSPAAEPQPKLEIKSTDVKTQPGQPSDQKAFQGPQKTAEAKPEPKPTQDTQKEAPPKTVPESKTTESVTGKMFGFGSSIFSSASTLISSAVQDESRMTPPGSRKMSAPAQASPKLSPGHMVSPKTSPTSSPAIEPKAAQKTEEAKKPIQPQEKKDAKVPAQVQKTNDCPLCKTKLNIGTKDPPNYNTCTECKATVCNQCGFSPMPAGEAKEWLCLNCQVKRAAAVPEPPAPQPIKSPSKAPAPSQKTVQPPAPEKKETSVPSVQKKAPESKPPEKVPVPDSQKKEDFDQQAAQQKPQKPSEAGTQSPRRQSKEQESGGFFGFGGPKSQSNQGKPEESVGGKMFGFGSSIFSSASTLITSAVDSPKSTPPVSPKLSSAKSPTTQKTEQEMKLEPQQTKTPLVTQAKEEKAPPAPQKKTISQDAVKIEKSICPLCKAQLNIGSKDPPNYSSCTECKNTVCNQCGFSPLPSGSGAKEWLCLNCQVKRAAAVPEPTVPQPIKSPSKAPAPSQKTGPVQSSAPEKKGTPEPALEKKAPESPQKVPAPDRQKTESVDQQAAQQKPQKTPQAVTLSPRRQSKEQDSGGFFGFGGPKSQPNQGKPEESVGGKMFGFGSSIFSSASTLITSAVQDSPKTTPPVSPKLSPAKSPATQKTEQEIKPEPQQTKTPPVTQVKEEKTPPPPPKKTVSQDAVKLKESTCPLCKAQLNIGSKDSPNYSSCTECKNTVCNQCGFSPLPSGSRAKEWLCLNCQVKRAAAVPEPPAPQPSKAPAPSQKTGPVQSSAPEKKDTPGPALQKKAPESQPPQKVPAPDSQKKESVDLQAAQQKTQKTPEAGTQSPRRQSKEQESAGIFGFGGPKSQPDQEKSESVGGKMFGFGSSIFSSASTLITSAVQDSPKSTPPVSPKLPPAKVAPATKPNQQKPEEQKKEVVKETKTTPPAQTKMDKAPLQPAKTAATFQAPAVKPGQSNCPLCKAQLNINTKDPPDYSTCTECKDTVCNQCGFNPSPNDLTAKEWLCLNCQMQRALAATEATNKGPEKEKKEPEAVDVKQKKPVSAVALSAKADVTKTHQASPVPAQKKPQEPVKTPDLERKQTTPAAQSPRRQSKEQESGGFFDFEGRKSQPDQGKPAESVGGKMFGFGSSIFSSASTLITSAVQDSPKTTPPVSPKLSPAKSPTAQKTEQEKKPEQTKTPPVTQAKEEKTPPAPQKKTVSQDAVKLKESTCLLCKAQLNIGSKDPPNYNSCTECKNTVCNQCGFSPLPSGSGTTTEWLCLTCQMQRALKQSEEVQPPVKKPLASPNKVASSPVPSKDRKDIPTTQKAELPEKIQIDITQQKKEETQVPSKISAPDSTGSVPSKEVPAPATQAPKGEAGIEKKAPPGATGTPKVPESKATKQEDQQTKPAEKVQTQQDTKKDAKTEESGGFFGFGSPKSQRSASIIPEPVTGKVLGFGSSLFSSASSLITSAVKEDSRTTPPSSRKMSAPPQVTEKTSPSKVSPKPSPPVSPKVIPAKDAKATVAQKQDEQRVGDKPQKVIEKAVKGLAEAAKAESSKPDTDVEPSSCPLCKVEINFKDSRSYNTCTQCKSLVCNKCGFSPMSTVSEVKEWLCLNCQMQRALGASEPPGLPMIKASPSKEIPVATQQKTPPTKDVVTKPVPVIKEAVAEYKVEEKKFPAEVTPTGPEKVPDGAPKVQPATPSQQPPKVAPITKPLEKESLPSMKPAAPGPPVSTSTAPPGPVEDKQPSELPVPKKVPPTALAEAKEPHTKPAQSTVTPAALKCPVEEKQPIEQPTAPAPSAGPVEAKVPTQQPSKPSEVTPAPEKVPVQVKPSLKPAVKSDASPSEAETKAPTEQPSKPTSEAKAPSVQSPKPVVKSAGPPGPPEVKAPSQQLVKATPSSPTPPPKAPAETKGPTEQAAKPGPPAAKSVLSKPPQQQPPTVTTAKPAQPPPQPKQESGGFFGFGGTKPQQAAQKPAESVTGKMFGFGSSFLSSASNLITSAVQDEPKTTPPTPRKMSATQVSPKVTPPASPKTVPSAAQKTEERIVQQEKKGPVVPGKVDKATPETAKKPIESKAVVNADKSNCPLCKVELNVGSTDSTNYNTCTECKKMVCNQCGFNPMPNVTEVKEWLCLDCQMKRALGPSESTGLPAMKPQAPSKELKDKPVTQKEKPLDAQVIKEVVLPTPPKKEVPKDKPSVPTPIQETVTPRKGSIPKPQATQQALPAADATKQQKPVDKPSQPTLSTKPDIKEAPPKQVSEKSPQQPSKPATSPAKAPQTQPPKQESGGFFGFGAPKTQPTAAKTESVTGKMFGFGSSFLSSASTLITSTVQDDPKTTPPVSPKLSPVKPKPGEKPEQPPSTKATPPMQKKVEKVPAEPPKQKEATAKAGPSTCPLCKVELNVGSKDSPNYNTCTECKNMVCNLCGFNPMPHTAAKEWLCLNCQTQRALSGQLGDSGKMSQPSPPSVKAEAKTPPLVKKTEPQPTPVETKPMPAAIKPKPEPPPVAAKPAIPAPKEKEAAPVKMEENILPGVTEQKADTKPIPPPVAPKTKPLPPAKKEPIGFPPEKTQPEVTKAPTLEAKREAEKVDVSVPSITKKKEPADRPKAEVAAVPAPVTPTKARVAPISTVAAEVAEVVPVAQKKPSEVIMLAKDKKDLPPDKEEPVTQEPQLENTLDTVSDSKAKAKLAETITKPTAIKTEKEVAKETVKEKREPSITMEETKVEISLAIVPQKDLDEHEPQVLPIMEDIKDVQVVSDANENTIKQDEPLPAKEDGKTERRRLSFQAMEESSESELTPSPKVQRRRLRVTRVSSSSEDMKTESADSSVEDEEFIRKQIMGMRDEEMSLSEDDKDKEMGIADRETIIDNVPALSKPTARTSTDNEETAAVVKVPLPATTTTTTQEVTEAVFKKATPAMRQRQSTDEEVESITESLSKGSSSVQASSFTPGSSPTSASSLDEDSDSSPSHRRATGNKPHRKGKHRQPTQPLPTIEDSSEEERMREEEKPWKDKDEDVSSSEELRGVTVVSDKTSGSDRSVSVESDTVDRQAVQRGRKPSPTVIPFTPEPVQQTVTKTLKSADEAYEEILQKAKAIPGDSPDIEPLYGGMSIEDYLYESLVEEPEMKICESEELNVDTEPAKKLRSPEEVYEEMMQKKRELIMIEQELQEAQTLLESAAAEQESCVVTIPTEESPSPPLDIPHISAEFGEVKKKKRPAPPRPSLPPQRPQGAVIPSPPTGISFVRPMVPQDPSLMKALFPIPHLKITQCSSGEEEEDSLADEYGVGMSSDITPSDDSDAKEPSFSPPLSYMAEMEPISVVCEIPEPKPIPTPISAPELTSTPSPVSPVSPPTSPATPESSLATSSSSYQAQTPPSLDSTPVSTPTPPTSVVTQSPPDTTASIEPRDIAAGHAVVVTIPDVVSEPSKPPLTDIVLDKARDKTAAEALATEPLAQMPDLVSSPSQMPVETSAITQVTASTAEPIVVSVQSTTQAVTTVVGPAAITQRGPVIVQMPDLVSTTPQLASAIVTTPSQAQATVVHSFTVQPAVPSITPVIVPASVQTTQVPAPVVTSTTIVKKKVPPPPPPRSTSVSLPDDKLARTVSPAITTAPPATSKPMQSVVVDIQPRIEGGAETTQLVTPTRQGHVMIIVPTKDKASLEGQTQESAAPVTTAASTPTATVPTKVPAPPVPPKPVSATKAPVQAVEMVEITVADTPPPAPTTLPKPPVSPKPQIPSVATTTTTTIQSQVPVTTSGPSQTTKPPPPIPPKPVTIPAGLVFSHKPGESVKPPYAMPKAATLPRTKEPPNALSLSITRPVESKMGATSPKSPVSPRYAKCVETYVVITLPSEPGEPGSPPEGITVVAPVRRGSISSTKVSEVRTTPAEQKTTETVAPKVAPRRASMPSVRYPPPVSPTTVVVVEQKPSKVVIAETQPKQFSVPCVQTVPSTIEITAMSSKDIPIQVQSVAAPIKKPYVPPAPITQPLPSSYNKVSEVIMLPSEPIIPIQPQMVQVTARAQPVIAEIAKETVPQAPIQTVQPQAPQPFSAVPLQPPEVSQDTQAPESTTIVIPQVETYIEIQTSEQDLLSDVTAEAVIETPAIVHEPKHISKESVHIIADLPQVTQKPSIQPAPLAADVTSTTKMEPPKEYIFEQAVILMPPPTAAEVMSAISPTAPDITTSSVIRVQKMPVEPIEAPVSYIEDSYAPTAPTVMQPPTPPLEVIALPYERLITEDARSTPMPVSVAQPVEVIATDETTTRRRTSITSIVQPTFVTSQTVPYPTEYEGPTQIVTTEAYAATRRESITLQQPIQTAEVKHMPTEKDISIDMPEPKPIFISQYDNAQIGEEMYTRRSSIPTQDIPQGVPTPPVTITKIQQESIESQEIRGTEKVLSSMSHVYSSSISTSGHPPESLPSLVTQVVTTEVQRTTVSVVHERLPQVPPSNVAITIQPDIAKASPPPKQNGRVYPVDVIDLRTMRDGVKMTEHGMDLTPPESCRQSFSSDSSLRQITAVQPEIVNLSAEVTPSTTLSVVTDSITIVTCTATIASYTPAEKPLDLQGSVTSVPLPLMTYKPFEPLAQIVYRPVTSVPLTSTVASTVQDLPMNLSYGALVSSKPPTSPSAPVSIGAPVISLEPTGAIDLSNYKPMRAIVAFSSTSPGVATTVIEDDDTPIDLTAGRRSVCCDVIYKLPFTGSCGTQPPVTTQPDSQYQQDSTGLYSIKGMNGMKVSLSDTNIPEVALVPYDPTRDLDYLNGASDGAIDLTAAKLSTGKPLDYTSKSPGAYPGMPTSPYGQSPAGFGVNSAIRTSDGMVYTSVAAPVPSTYAITTQPGSIFSSTLSPMLTAQHQALVPYNLIPTTDPGQIIPYETGLPKELLPTALADIITGYQEMYSDTTLEAIAASLDALATSPLFPGLDSTKMAQYQMEREFLELEKLKQLCLAEELEWERQEIQRYREQEQFMVQRELEELQTLKQQLLLQQEEEHHAHMMAQQETYNQQKEQLQQIQQLQLQLQRQLDEHYGTNTAHLLEAKYAGVGDSGQYWPVKDESSTPAVGVQLNQGQDKLSVKKLQVDQDTGKKIIDSGVHTDDEDSEKQTTSSLGRRKKTKRTSDSSPPTDDEDDWDAPTKARRRSRKHSSEGKHGSKVSSIAIQTVAEISVQTDYSGTIKKPIQMDTKVEIIKHISAPENSQRGGSLSCQTDSDRRHAPIEVGYSTHLTAEGPCKTKVFYSPVSPLSPDKSGQRMLMADPNRFSSGPRSLKPGQKSLSDPKSLSPTTDDRMGYYGDGYSGRGSPSSTGKKVKRTLPDPPPEDESLSGRSGYSTNSARRRLARSTTMARAKILQDIDKELDLVERESSKLRKKQAELDEEEKEIDAKLRYLEMGINRRKEVLLQEREKRERAYLQGVAEERDYMSDSEVSNIREDRGEGLERPRTAPQSEFDQFIPPQTEADSQYNTLTSPYSHYAQYVPQTQTTSHYTQQNLYQQQSLYHQQVSPYQSVPTLSLSQAQPSSYQHALLLQQGKQRQSTLSDLEPKIATNYEVIRNQPLLIVPTSSESGYGVAQLGSKFANLDLRLGLEERSMASSPMSSISADSFYADIDHHNARNYVLIEDIGELTKASSGLGSSGFSLPDKELSKADRLMRAAEVRRTAEMADFLGSSRLQGYSKGEEDTMEEPYELKLLKQQIKQEFRRGAEGLEHLTGLGLPQYIHSDPTFRHFPKGEKYSIGRLTLEKQAAKQLPAAVLYQKQMKNKKAMIDPKAISKCSPIQESRDLEPDFASYMGSGASSVTNLAARARLLQDEITFGLRKNLAEQQKYLGSSLGSNLASSLNLGQSLGLGSAIRGAVDDGTYPSGSRSRPSSRPSSVYGLDLSIKRDLSSSSLRLKQEGDVLDAAFAPGVTRTKPTSLPISQSRGRIPIVAQNSEEESPLSPVGQPMGMARASAGPLPPISADSRDQFGSSHSLPEVQQHMREESRTRGYDRDIAFIMDDLQGAMSDSEAYHLRREDTDWFDKPREGHPQGGHMDRRQIKLVPYAFPHARIKLKRDQRDTSVSGNGLGIRVVGGKEIPGSRGEIGAYIATVIPGGSAEQTGKVTEGMQVLEWNGVPLTGKTYEEVQCIVGQPCVEAELCVRLDLNMLSDPEHPQVLEHQFKSSGQRSPGVDPKQLAAELQKVSQQQGPGVVGAGMGPGGLGVLSALERSALLQSGPGSAASSGVPSPGQPASPAINKKQRHKTEVTRIPHPITGEIQLQINYDRNLGNLIVHVLQARNLAPRDNDGYSDPFVKVYLLPGRGADNKRRTKYAQKTCNPEWNQTVIYKNIHLEQLIKKTLEVTVWDYDRSSSNDFLGEVLIDLSNTAQLDNVPRWLPLKEQSESIEHSRTHHGTQGPPGSGAGTGQAGGHMSGMGPGGATGHGLGQGDGSHDSPKNSVIKSRSHGIFPDPSKDMQMLPLEKSHSSPGSSKSSSEGQLRSHGPSRSQSKSSVTQAHLEDAGIAIAAAEAAVQQSRLQPRPGHRLADVSGAVVLSAPSLVGEAYGDGEDGGTGVDSAIFQVPRMKAIPNGTDKHHIGTPENEGGKVQVMGEIKIALKKEVKTEGDQLVLEILQCRNITYKFKSPDHLPDLYVKLYVVNVATQKRIIKKKTRVCRHDREPSFNETFRFPLNPTGHSIQLFLVSNGGKFMKKTLIGEAYIWLDKVDMRKRVVSWHKLLASTTPTNP